MSTQTGSILLVVMRSQERKNKMYMTVINIKVYNLDFQEHKQLFDLHVGNNPQEVLLGGFITGD